MWVYATISSKISQGIDWRNCELNVRNVLSGTAKEYNNGLRFLSLSGDEFGTAVSLVGIVPNEQMKINVKELMKLIISDGFYRIHVPVFY